MVLEAEEEDNKVVEVPDVELQVSHKDGKTLTLTARQKHVVLCTGSSAVRPIGASTL